MMGLDTNILVRYLVRDDERQARIADLLIESAEDASDPLFVNNVVLCELAWVLRSGFRLKREEIQDVLEGLLDTRAFQFEDRDLAMAALQDFRLGGADYPDCLIGRKNRALGCEATLTFDGLAARMATFRAL